jgi:hypothetical protein
MLMQDAAAPLLLTLPNLFGSHPPQPDTLQASAISAIAPVPVPAALLPDGMRLVDDPDSWQDTT